MSDPKMILKDTGSMEQTNRLVCMYAETVFHHELTLCRIVLEAVDCFCFNLVKQVFFEGIVKFFMTFCEFLLSYKKVVRYERNLISSLYLL